MFSSTQTSARRTGLRILGLALIALFGMAGRAYSQCGSPANQVVAENCLPGNPSSQWDVGPNSAGDTTIQGFATDISVNQGSTIYFKINTPVSAYTITIYRMGYYGGMGARQVAQITPSVPLPQIQPACLTDNSTGLMDCGNWGVTASWQVPANAVSGIYFAHLVRSDTGGDSQIVFVVRNDASTSQIMYQTSDETWQAYNYYGGGSLYGQNTPVFDLNNRSYKVSYNRPFLTRSFQEESDSYVFGAEFAMVQWLESNGYDVTYSTSVDAARSGQLIQNHKVFMDAGHDEYWSGPRRANVQAARDAGVNLAFFSGNEMFWKTRWENSIDGTKTPYRTLVCYKETLAFAQIDPLDPPTWTGTWRDPSFSPPADGGKPENAMTGTLFMVNGTGSDNQGDQQITIPAADGKMRFWRNTAVASLAANASYSLPVGTLGYEWDVDPDNGFRPAGAFHLSTSTYTLTSDYLLDYGATYGAGAATHHLMTYRAPSGALVFGAGTVNWSWALNSNHDNPFYYNTPNPDPNAQQATVNLLADMGAQPATLQPGLVAATASTDKTPPISVIASPASGAALSTGNTITISGTATDSGGGVVAGVEVSADGGNTWHPATGRGSWSYSWTPNAIGSPTLLSRAVDDSGNLETPGDATVVNVSPQTCPCSIWRSSRSPVTVDSGDGNSVEVGVKFRADSNGSILGVKFFKATTNTGTHVGHIWTDTGALLGTATFTGESGAGWQQVYFSEPIPISANTTYVVSYFAPNGHYAADNYYFATSNTDNPPLHALENGVDGQNGLFLYSQSGGYPTSSYLASNYWVDVLFTSSNTYNIAGNLSGYGGAGASVSLTGTETATVVADGSGNYSFNGIVDGTYTVTPSNPGVTFTPSSQTVAIQQVSASGVNFTAVVTNPLSITGTIAGGAGATVNLGGSAVATTTADASGNYSFTGLLNGSYTVTPVLSQYVFTPASQNVTLAGSNATAVNFSGQVCNCISIWSPSAIPTLVDSGDGKSIEVGVKFQVDAPGVVDGVRFYKASTNIGTHVGHLWTSAGALLGTATFTGESASGWQAVNFSTPIQIVPGTVYIASYLAPVGHYSADTNYFATSGVDNPPVHALVNTANNPDGVYVYTPTVAFPANTYSATNYWVDILYTPDTPYSLSGTIAGGAGATVTLAGTTTPPATADAKGNYTISPVYSGTYNVVPSGTGLVFSPGNQTVTVGAAPVAGVNFAVPQICPCDTIWAPTTLPGVVDSNDPLSYELGVKFEANADGYILGVRYYKSPTNTGLHIGNLWSTSSLGSPLASAPFANESSTGWQQVLFNSPVPVSGNTTYIGSYFTPTGHYSVDTGFFASGVNNPPLQALADGVNGPNGVYTNSSMSAFPNTTYQQSNYWVDVIYATTSTYSIGGTISGLGTVGVTVSLSGAANATTTTDAYGNYYFNGLANGTYTVTPNLPAGFILNPANQTVTVAGSHQLNTNFTSSLPTYAVSGTVSGAPGITVNLTGTVTATSSTLNVTVTADASGNFTFPAVPNGSYTVTPSPIGFLATPGSQSIIVNGTGVSGVNFSAIILYYSLSGTIQGGAGATVTLSGPVAATATADGSGNYSFTGLTVGTYSVVPSFQGLIFNPGNLNVTLTSANVTGVNFNALTGCPCDTIWQPSAVPALIDSGDGSEVEVGVKFRVDADAYIVGLRYYKATANTGTHTGNLWSSAGTLIATAKFVNEGANGWQQVLFANPVPVTANTVYVASYFSPFGHYSADVNYFATAGVDAPPLHALANGVSGGDGVYLYSATSGFPSASGNGANYWVDIIDKPTSTYSIAGNVGGAGGPGATVTLSGPGSATTTADASGNFSFSGLANGAYTVTPSKNGYAYSPSSQSATINNAHALGLSFSSSAAYTVSGTIGGPGGPGATVSLSGAATATVIADSSGNWAFPNLINGAYTVAVANPGYAFTPASQSVTVNGANTTAPFTSSSGYALSMAASSLTLAPGVGGTIGVTVTSSNGFSGTVNFAQTGIPAAINNTFLPTSSTTGSTLVIYVPAGTAGGSYLVTVTGSSGGASVSTAFTFVVLQSQTIAFGTIANNPVGAQVTLTATANSGLAVAYASSTPTVCTVNGSVASLIASGTCTITASQPGNAIYAAATPVSQSFVSMAPPGPVSLSSVFNVYGIFNTGSAVSNGGLDTSSYAYPGGLLGTSIAWSGAQFTLANPGVPSAVSSKTIPLPAGSFASLQFLGTAVYGAQSNQPFVVNYTDGTTSSFTQSLSDWGASKGFAGESVAKSVAYRITPSGSTQNGPWNLYGYSLTLNSAKTVSSIVLPNNRNVVVLAMILSGAPSPQTITFGAIANGQPSGASLPLTATASSGLAVSFASSTPAVCTVSGSTASLLTAGTCTIVASQAGNSAYSPAPSVSQSFSVFTPTFTLSPASSSLTITAGQSGTIGISVIPVNGFAGSVTFSETGVPGGISTSFTPASSTTGTQLKMSVPAGTAGGSYTVTVAGASGTLKPTATFTLNVLQTQTISFGAIATQKVGTPLSLSATASSGLAVSFASTTSAVCAVSGTSATFLTGGACSIVASQAGNAKYAPAASVTESFTVTAPSFTLTPAITSGPIARGAGGTDKITINDVGGFNGAVTFSISGFPAGVTTSFSPATASFSTVLVIDVGTTAAPGTYVATITGTSGTLKATTTISLTIPTPDFSLTLSSAKITLTKSGSAYLATSDTVTTAALNGFSGSETLKVTGAPAGLGTSFSPTSIATAGSSRLSLTPSGLKAGTYTLTVTGTSGSLTHSATLTIVAP